MNPSSVPYVDPALVAYLDRLYPEKTPGLHATIDQIRWDGGARSVVRFLAALVEEQEATELPQVIADVSSQA